MVEGLLNAPQAVYNSADIGCAGNVKAVKALLDNSTDVDTRNEAAIALVGALEHHHIDGLYFA